MEASIVEKRRNARSRMEEGRSSVLVIAMIFFAKKKKTRVTSKETTGVL